MTEHPWTESTQAVAERLADNLIALLEEHMSRHVHDPQATRKAWEQAMRLRGVLQSAAQLRHLEALVKARVDVERADTERPSALRVVR